MTVRKHIVWCAAALAALMLAGCPFPKKQQDAQQSGDIVRINVTTGLAAKRNLRERELYTGVLEPLKKADLAPATPGRVRRIPVQIGQYVRTGQTLAVMDDVTLVATQAQFEPVKAQYERTKRLYESNAVSKAQFEGIEAQYLALKRQLEQIEENTTIRAPFSGVVTSKSAEEGELYSSMGGAMGNSRGLIQLVQLNPLKVDLNLDENTVVHVKKGMAVELTVSAIADTTFMGTVQWVNPSADERSHTFEVRIVVKNDDGALRAGYFVQAAVIVGERQNVLSVPSTALVGKRVFSVENDSIAVAHEVETGWVTEGYVEIVSGLAEGATVVVSGNKALPDSSIVIVADSSAQTDS